MAEIHAEGQDPNLTSDLTAAPADGDTLNVGVGSVLYASGLDLTAADLLLVRLLAGWNGGTTPAAPLKVVANRTATGKVLIAWGGRELYLESSGPAGVIHQIEVAPAADGRVYLGPMDNANLVCKGGFTQCNYQCDVNKAYAYGSSRLQLLKDGPTVAELYASGPATVDLWRACTLMEAGGAGGGGGVLRVLRDTITPTHVYARAGGRIEYAGGAITNLYGWDGAVLDFTKLTKPLTVTNRHKHGKVRVLLKASGPPVAYTNTLTDLAEWQEEYV